MKSWPEIMSPLKSQWDEAEANFFIERYGPKYGEAVALRTYSSRLLGAEPSLVLHGGGNTSVKSSFRNILGQDIPAIFVKGSGWDLASLEPAGLPGLDLHYLQSLRVLKKLSDESMVNELRTHLFDASAPTPSVETLLHAFLPHKFIDHSHADLILVLTNNDQSQELLQKCFGDNVVLVPYVMPGFELAKLAADCFEKQPDCEAMILLKHGLFTFGKTAKESYESHLSIVNRASEFLLSRSRTKTVTKTARVVKSLSNISPEMLLPLLRGVFSQKDSSTDPQHWILSVDSSPEILTTLADEKAQDIFQTGPLTPDHILRTKEFPLFLSLPKSSHLDELSQGIHSALQKYKENYDSYFQESSQNRNVEKSKLDAIPRVILIPDFGMITIGETKKAADIAFDIAQHTLATKSLVSSFAKYTALPQLDLFDVEYWGLEQAKLLLNKPKQLAGRVVVITGGSGAIGMGIANALKSLGAEVVITDIKDTVTSAKKLGVLGIDCDVSNDESVRHAFTQVIQEYGGVDIVIPNAGIAYSAPISKLDTAKVQQLHEVNYMGSMRVIREAAKVFELQKTGGHVIIISSKNVFAPGREFSAYSSSKAALHQMGKIAALELASLGVKVNMINPDAVFGDEATQSGLWKEVGPGRAAAHGIPFEKLEAHYQERNLLKTKVTAEDVGRAVVFFATDQTPTTGATLPVDGGIPEAFPR